MPEIVEIVEALTRNFSIKELSDFLFLKNQNFTIYDPPERLYQYERERFVEIYKIGNVRLDDNKELFAFAIKTEGELTERSSKRAQYELAKTLLKIFYAPCGIFVFFDNSGNFRFSLVYAVYHGTRATFSHYRRYTYYVAADKPYRTFIRALTEARFDTLENIILAFSTQPLTKEFYTEVQNWYAWALKHAQFPGGTLEENLIRLLTRLIFVWFLKERKLIPDKIFDHDFLKNIISNFGKNDFYYNTILQNLFFATLNRYPDDRRFTKNGDFFTNRQEFGLKTLYRYKEKILIEEKNFIKIFENVPFINGGLFECLDDNGNYIDGFSRREDKRAKLPDFLFFGEERIEDLSDFYGERKKTRIRGLINILKDYNFTADESSPIDIEVSLDPELLGHIFENLLASYNPETQTTARKATGSYYTPKEIVDFMVEESLLEYFKTKTNIDEQRLRDLLSYSEETVELTNEEKQSIIHSIDTLKLIDPAVGSGAFPMGAVHKLVHILNKVDPDNELWYELQYHKALHEVEEVLKIRDKSEREQLLKELNENFDENINYPDYARKLYIIENSIFGVDIQSIAIQICKLRFFLSLLIDQKIDRTKPNFGIKPLPHLETKFVAANTLIGLDKPIQLNLENTEIIEKVKEQKEKLKKLYKKHFNIKTRTEKKKIQKEAEKIRNEIKEMLKHIGWDNYSAEKIANFDIFSQTATADWFDPEWMFGVEDGFDIMIGNPPYISTKSVDSNTKKLLEKNFGFADDTYNHFYFKGIELLKVNGILAYISSKTFWTIQTKKNLRELLLKNTILQIFDTANPFASAMVDTCVTIVQKKSPKQNQLVTFLDGRKDLLDPAYYTVLQNIYATAPNKVFFIPTQHNIKVYERLGKKVNELLNNWWDNISTSKNIEKNKQKLEEYRKNLKPGDITLLGLITEGGQGLATANNGKYIGVLDGTKWAENVRKQRPEKLLLATAFCKKQNIKTKQDAQSFLDRLSEKEIRKLFDDLKEDYSRDIFGQGWLYRIVSKDEIADVEALTEDEKLNGIAGTKTFVPYDKGDKDGNRWYAPTPYYIDWSRENVKFLKENSGKKGEGMPVVRKPQFYFREGFCWNNVLSDEKIKCRLKEKSVHSTEAMTFISMIPEFISDKFLICLMNSTFFGEYRMNFINVSHHLTTGDAKEFPIIVPTSDQLKRYENIFDRAYNIQKQKFEGKISEREAEEKLAEVQRELDEMVERMYMGE